MTTKAYSHMNTLSAVAQITEAMSALSDAADGIRRSHEERGWSPTAAEAAALTFYQEAVRMTFRSQQQVTS